MMVLLSFSVKEAELRAGIKVRSTRLYTLEKWEQWQATIPPNNTKLLDLWWKSRTPDGYLIDERPGADLYRLKFLYTPNGDIWPCKEYRSFSERWNPMSIEEAHQWSKEEGFEDELNSLRMFFTNHYDLDEYPTFQSIAFPPKVI